MPSPEFAVLAERNVPIPEDWMTRVRRMKFWREDQERAPAGSPEGGQFVDEGGGSDEARAEREWDEQQIPDAIHDYTQNSYEQINGYLRGGKHAPPKGSPAYKDAEESARLIKLAFENPKVYRTFEKNTTLYRGIESNAVYNALKNAPLGKVITDKAFVSTSTLPHIAELSANEYGTEKRVLLTIFADKGARYIKARGDEHEILLRNGSRFRIIRKQMEPKTYANHPAIRVSVRLLK